jgi:hypothetical protein
MSLEYWVVLPLAVICYLYSTVQLLCYHAYYFIHVFDGTGLFMCSCCAGFNDDI